jgi:hypothetical protein
MSDKAEEFAKQLLEKTDSGKLQWSALWEGPSENYRADLGDGYSFSIKRVADGDNKVLSFWLTGPEGIVLSATADNLPATLNAIGKGALIGNAFVPVIGLAVGAIAGHSAGSALDFAATSRFQLFSDLFYAARKNASQEIHAMEKVQELLERLG